MSSIVLWPERTLSVARITSTTFLPSCPGQRFSSSRISNLLLQKKLLLQAKQVNRDSQRQLASILCNYPTSSNITQQIHSHLLTSGFIGEETDGKLLLFNALIRSYSLSDRPLHAFYLYKQLLQSYLFDFYSFDTTSSFDSFTYSFLIKAAANTRRVLLGTQVHSRTEKLGFESNVYVQTALVDMYVVLGEMDSAWKVFDVMPDRNSISWNVMITGLINWGKIESARRLFEEMPYRTVVSWTGLIDGYTRLSSYDEAIELFKKMVVLDGILPNEISVLAIFPAVSGKRDLGLCQSIHGLVEKRGFSSSDIRVANALIDAYAKCGCIASATKFFEEISEEQKTTVSWTSLISAFAMHGMGKEAVDQFERLEKTGLTPSSVTFLSVLTACSHGGLVKEGLEFFYRMVENFKMSPDIKHYGCLVDMLGRAGRLEEAEKLALEIPENTINSVVWRILLGSCSFHGNVEIGERATQRIMELEEGYGGDYVLMSNIFVGAERFSDAENLRRLMQERKAQKTPGGSMI